MEHDQLATEPSRLSSPIVTIKAGTGDQQQTFYVHENLVTENSEFFKAAFKRQWTEGQTRVLELPDDQAKVVEAFLEWLYSNTLTTTPHSELSGPDRANQYSHLARLYVFGEKIQHDGFCDKVITTILAESDEIWQVGEQSYRCFPAGETVTILYNGTPEGSPARKLMVHLHAERGRKKWMFNELEVHHPAFMLDLLRVLLDRYDGPGSQGFDSVAKEGAETWLKEKKPEEPDG